MRTIFFILSISFALLVIYRRIVEPFLEGLRGARKPYNRTPKDESRHGLSKDKEIKDAEFKEIK